MKKSNYLYSCAVFATVLFVSACAPKKDSGTKGGGSIDSISVVKVQPTIDSISVKQGSSIDSISVTPKAGNN
ncbi:MAG: hypothetical protein K9G41_09730 [Flavobacteriales bacterium]|nr:hypothetical protein [Flavobacteriales bacterium]